MTSVDLDIKIHTSFRAPNKQEQEKLVNFLFDHLDKYGDPKEDINKALNFAFKHTPSFGGYVIALEDNNKLVGVVVVNKTGMKGYIPENILVYIAIHDEYRGQGLGKKLMQEAMQQANGDIALHVEPDNPARFLYEKLGFNSKYLEMRATPAPKVEKKKKVRNVLTKKILGVNMYPFLI